MRLADPLRRAVRTCLVTVFAVRLVFGAVVTAAPAKQREKGNQENAADRDKQIVKSLALPARAPRSGDPNEVVRCKPVSAKTIEKRFGAPDEILAAKALPFGTGEYAVFSRGDAAAKPVRSGTGGKGNTLVRWKSGDITFQLPIAGRVVTKETEGWEVRRYGDTLLFVNERGMVIGLKPQFYRPAKQ